MQLFHYHLVTRKAREVEARYVAKLGFELVARHGRVGDAPVSFEPGVSWEELDARGFRLRLSEALNAAPSTSSCSPASGCSRGSTISAWRSTRTSSPRHSNGPPRAGCACRSARAGARSSRRARATGSSSTRRATGSTSCSSRPRSCTSPSCTCPPTTPRRRPGRSRNCPISTRDGTGSRSARRPSASCRGARPGAPSSRGALPVTLRSTLGG